MKKETKINADMFNTDEFFEKIGVDPTNLSYKQKIRILKDYCFDKDVDLDILDMIPFDKSVIEQQQMISLQIYDAKICINKIKYFHKYERKEKAKQLIKQILPQSK